MKLRECLGELREGCDADRPERQAVINAILLFLVWMNLQEHDLPAANRWMTELDGCDGDLAGRVELRSALLSQLSESGNLEGFVEQARHLLADRFTDRERHAAAILDAVAVTYSRVSRSACLTVLEAAHDKLRDSPVLKAAANIVPCARDF